MRYLVAIGVFIVSMAGREILAQDVDTRQDDEAAIRTMGEAYVEAFHQRDAEAVAAFWAPRAVYTNRLTGEQVVGREAIAEQFASLFESTENLKLEIDIASIEFVSPNVAVEHGLATFSSPDAKPEEINYSAVYVRHEDQWLLDRVTDKPTPKVHSNYEHLQDLEWMIGRWVDEDENVQIVTECNWTKNKNFITRSFLVSAGDRVEMSGMQIVGWDPAAKQIRSWTFDSQGGFAEGNWTRNEEGWTVHKRGVLEGGGQASALNIIKVIDNDSFTFQAVNRIVDGELLPNVNEVQVVRQD